MQTQLPIGAILDELESTLAGNDTAVLEAPPGSGKTTVVPLALLEQAWLGKGRILLLEPRRIAARAAAFRMAQTLGEAPGQTVGYRMRLETRVSDRTRIEVITEGILTHMLQDDPSLAGVALVIFDEFHERSLDADLALSLCLKARALFRTTATGDPPLKLLVMSATLQSGRVSQLMGDAPVIRAAGRLYPVDIIYSGSSRPNDRIVDRTVAVTLQAIEQHPASSLLVFLPGQGEIERCRASLEAALTARNITGVAVMPLFGNLSLAAQQAVIMPVTTRGLRKVVLATNIAETSLTIEGVDVVIDSGLARAPVFDPATAMTRLATRKISQASSTQRAGRAGRLRAGTCYRLWSAGQQDQLAAHSEPEILSADLTSLALQLFKWGVPDPAEMDWMDPPPRGAWQQAVSLLKRFGALSGEPPMNATLTSAGEQLAALPVHPRLARLMIQGARIDEVEIATLLAATLSDRDPFAQEEPDITHRIDILLGDTPCPARHRSWASRVRQLAQQYKSRLETLSVGQVDAALDRETAVGYLLTCA
jgi:ATP-dependent helicase HrpB